MLAPLPVTTLPIRVASPTVPNCGSIRRTATSGSPGSRPVTQIAPPAVTRSVGISRNGSERTTLRWAGSTRETVWSSSLVTHNPPGPEVTAPGLTPTGTWATTRLEPGSIAASELGETVTLSLEPPAVSATARATAARPATPAQTTTGRRYSGRRRRVFSGGKSARRPSITS
jgi:hypothetical protein